MKTLRRAAVVSILGLISAASALGYRTAEAQTTAIEPVTVGITNSGTDAALLIAAKLGYFKEQGIDAKLLPFEAAGKMMAPLSVGQLDVATGAPSAALYNALATHINLKIVADKGSAAPGYGFQPILVRKALITSGKYKSPKDLKGLTFAEGGPGSAAVAFIAKFLKTGGLKYSDVTHVYLGFPSMAAAFDNGAIDAGALAEPLATIAERSGSAVRVAGNDQIYPNQQLTVLMYGGAFIDNRRAVAQRFMLAYLKGVRYYNDALVGGHLRGRTADDVIGILTEVTGTKDPSIFRAMTASANDPNGHVNVASLKADALTLHDLGFVTSADVDFSEIVDMSFADAAVQKLGPYRAHK